MEIQREKIAISFFLIAFLISFMTAFQFKAGQCPEVEPMKNFEMKRFLGVWHVIQGTVTGSPVMCITFNVTEGNSNRFILTQIPQNWPSELMVQDETKPAKMNIHMNDSSDAVFDVLVTDYDNFAGFFICKNSDEKKFQRAAAFLSRTKSLSDLHYNIVKTSFQNYGIRDEDLTIVLDCE